MKFGTVGGLSITSFSLHQSGTVMKCGSVRKYIIISFSLHQSGTVMKYMLI